MFNKGKIRDLYFKWRLKHKDSLLRYFKDKSNQYDLAPVYINREDENGNQNPKYGPVEDIANKLGDEKVRNIALTGPYGSGKSSVLRTLMRDYPKAKYLSISLATLEDDTLYKDLIDRDKNKNSVTLLTTNGVVTVKIFGEIFSHYDRRLSEVGADGKKHIIEKSWFSRGEKIIVTGIKKGNMFIAKKYARTPFHIVERIEDIDKFGRIKVQKERKEV